MEELRCRPFVAALPLTFFLGFFAPFFFWTGPIFPAALLSLICADFFSSQCPLKPSPRTSPPCLFHQFDFVSFHFIEFSHIRIRIRIRIQASWRNCAISWRCRCPCFPFFFCYYSISFCSILFGPLLSRPRVLFCTTLSYSAAFFVPALSAALSCYPAALWQQQKGFGHKITNLHSLVSWTLPPVTLFLRGWDENEGLGGRGT